MTHLNTTLGPRLIDSELSEASFGKIAELSKSYAGIVLSPSKTPMVKSRLTRRLRKLKISSFDDYLKFLESPDGASELGEFISALTTNVSQFFREDHHFAFFRETILPALKEKLKQGQKVRIWSAGCSTGQEPYTLAMTMLDCDSSIAEEDIKILATDIDPVVLRVAAEGAYSEAQIAGIPQAFLQDYFDERVVEGASVYHTKPSLKNLVSYRQLNLNASWPMKGKFDLIMCRNVMIYFDEQTQDSLLEKFAQKMDTSGWLMIGHSERMPGKSTKLFNSVGVTTYQLQQQPSLAEKESRC